MFSSQQSEGFPSGRHQLVHAAKRRRSLVVPGGAVAGGRSLTGNAGGASEGIRRSAESKLCASACL